MNGHNWKIYEINYKLSKNMGYRYKKKRILEETKHISKQTKKIIQKNLLQILKKFSIKKK